ncbi:hypothetical protein FOMPIDRAFT_1048361 [Fomitopsis schrenkii]|uniref:Uncharacterized protein n=1 Tax=Fomitopsis schrenkii TaxID=2126942 RepID=S8FK18_FOMSC|nr:hypothetical protein FOMPIDRAFT_1048361 [Fomitopsis schrenkii]
MADPGTKREENPAATPEKKVKPRHRVGKGPFMAIDLLQDEVFLRTSTLPTSPFSTFTHAPLPRTVRSGRRAELHIIPQWGGVDLVKVERNKRSFLQYFHKYDEVFQCASVDFGPSIVGGFLYNSWILFGDVTHQSGEADAFRRNRFFTPEDERILLS